MKSKHKTGKITLILIEETSSGPYWEVRVEGDKNFSLVSDELVINWGPERPSIRFTSSGMDTMCPICGGEIRFGFQDKVPNWWCTECGHHKTSRLN